MSLSLFLFFLARGRPETGVRWDGDLQPTRSDCPLVVVALERRAVKGLRDASMLRVSERH